MSKTVLITGASGGIGAATAELFLSQGWEVGLVARRAERLEALAGGRSNAHVLPGDVTRPEVVEQVLADFVKATGRLDVLFNNAGIFTPPGLIDEVPLESWQAALDVNLTAMFLCARTAFGIMRAQAPQGGRIINNGSISAHVPRPGSVTYSVTKHAITGLTKTLSLDGRDFDIACGQIDIGNARTDMVAEIAARAQAAGEEPPATMDVEDVARAVLHMAELPPEANILNMTIMANRMAYVGRG
jgi:NAD(P)-dependent dehydrogenase (short-subunit alcohol dehydrogenase family)